MRMIPWRDVCHEHEGHRVPEEARLWPRLMKKQSLWFGVIFGGGGGIVGL
jgi:hypothetical protein